MGQGIYHILHWPDGNVVGINHVFCQNFVNLKEEVGIAINNDQTNLQSVKQRFRAPGHLPAPPRLALRFC